MLSTPPSSSPEKSIESDESYSQPKELRLELSSVAGCSETAEWADDD